MSRPVAGQPRSIDLSGLVEDMVGAQADVQNLLDEAGERRAHRNTLARELESHGMTQRAIAARLGVAESTVTRLLAFGPFDPADTGEVS